MAKRSNGNYPVGKGRPPIHTRFQKGESGNPHGRPKGSIGASSLAKAELKRTVTVTVNSRKRKLSVAQIAARRLGDKAMSGDPKAFMLLIGLANADGDLSEETKSFLINPERDGEILKDYFQRSSQKVKK